MDITPEKNDNYWDKTEDKIDFVLETIKRHDLYITSVNFKVALLMSFVIAVLLSFMPLLKVMKESSSDLKGVMIVLLIITVLTSFAAAIYLYKAVFPSLSPTTHGDSVLYFRDIYSNKTANDYLNKINTINKDDLLHDLVTQSHTLAGIVEIKMYYIQEAIKVIIILTIPYLITLVTWSFSAFY